MGVLVAFGRRRQLRADASAASTRATTRRRCRSPTPRGSRSTSSTPRWRRIRVDGVLRGHLATRRSSAPRPSSTSASASLNVEGHLGFDALFQFSPVLFHDRHLGVAVGQACSAPACSPSASAAPSEGPTPWHIEGTGSISLLFLGLRRRLRRHLGRRARTPSCRRSRCCRCSPRSSRRRENWTAAAAGKRNRCWCRCARSSPDADLVLHPLGSLRDQPARGAARHHPRQARQRRSPTTPTASRSPCRQRRPAARRRRSRVVRAGAVPGPRRRREAVRSRLRAGGRRHRAGRRRLADPDQLHDQAGGALRADHHRHLLSPLRAGYHRLLPRPVRPLPRRQRDRPVRGLRAPAATGCACSTRRSWSTPRRTPSPTRPPTRRRRRARRGFQPRAAAQESRRRSTPTRRSPARSTSCGPRAGRVMPRDEPTRLGRHGDDLGTYSFLPWLRLGLANQITAADSTRRHAPGRRCRWRSPSPAARWRATPT